MKRKNLPIVFFVCMGILLALMYGVFKLGGFGMEACEKVLKIILISVIWVAIIIVTVFFCIAIWKAPISCKEANIYFDEFSLPPDVKNIFVLKENLSNKDGKKIDADAVIYLDEDSLNTFNFLGNLKYIYFVCAEPKIEKSFYENLVKSDVSINICNGSKLEIIDNNKISFVEFFLPKKNEVSNKIDASGKIEFSADISK